MLRTKALPILSLVAFFLTQPIFLWAQEEKPFIRFTENKGQWDSAVQFSARVPDGKLFLETDGLMYNFVNEADVDRIHDIRHGSVIPEGKQSFLIHGHAFKVTFRGCNPFHMVEVVEKGKSSDYQNYFLGNDSSKWASNVFHYNEIIYRNIYPNIDFRIYGKGVGIKYDFIVHPGGDPVDIQLVYDGLETIDLEQNSLKIRSSVNELIEEAPIAFQQTESRTKSVRCNFTLINNTVGFEFPKRYDRSQDLIIDPSVVFSTYIGSVSDSWGFTATYDDDGHLYTGGISFGPDYPTTTGAYITDFRGGSPDVIGSPGREYPTDVVITKYSPDGTNLIYSTFLGGEHNECPHSLVVDNNNQLLVLGTTSSPNFPTSTSAYDRNFDGGSQATINNVIRYKNGSDIFISKLNSNGSDIVGSTFMGGVSNDGLNLSSQLNYNYSDEFKGEIIVDDANNCLVVSTTQSSDFPTAGTVPQPGFGNGGQDVCVFRLSPNLDQLIWGTFLGGNGPDAGYSIQLSPERNILVTGGTNSSNFFTSDNVIQQGKPGGIDGFITVYTPTGNSVLASTFIGTPSYDQTFFIQSDTDGDIYVLGQTEGNYPITPASVYANPNSGQFIHKLSQDLTSTEFSTQIGSGRGEVDITFSAFLVNDCGQIYIAGWGGEVNQRNGGPQESSTDGLPFTNNAYQTLTDGNDYYLMMLEEDAEDILYATFFGGSSTEDHCDGGTSRFDKNGTVYQTLCASCGSSNNDLPTTPNAWSSVDSSSNCNIAAIKFDLNRLDAFIDPGNLAPLCLEGEYMFINNSVGGTEFFWDFGDGSTSTDRTPSHLYTSPGKYTVSLSITDPLACPTTDTSTIEIQVAPLPTFSVSQIDSVCANHTSQLQVFADPVYGYQWKPGHLFSDSTSASPTVTLDTTTYLTVLVSDGICTDSIVFPVNVRPAPSIPGDFTDIIVDFGNETRLFADPNARSYHWYPSEGLSCTDCPNPIADATESITYYVDLIGENGCDGKDSVEIRVAGILYYPNTFTPNGDDINESFRFYGKEIVEFELYIYNRWGEQIFHSQDLNKGWNGKVNGKMSPSGVYPWRVNYTDLKGLHYEETGHVNLFR